MKVFVLWEDKRSNRICYIGEKHFRLIRERFARGERFPSLLYPLSRPDLVRVILAKESDLREFK